ncbi:MAG: NB-ARC domain-containing protein [Limisphaerales bacterium]
MLDAPEQSPVGIHGVGGMGKTALAQVFAYKEADAFPGGCWLLRCEGRDRLLFRNLVNDLEIELIDDEKPDDAKAVRRLFDLLRARGPAMFLLDNVDHPALLAQEQMKLLANQPWARVLYTTRLAPDDFTKAGTKIRPLDLDRLLENQAVDLIRRYQPRQAFASPDHEAAAREIVRELSGLTLAVETAAVYLGQCDPRVAEPQYAVDVRNYLNKLREDLKTGGSEGVMSQLREVTATLRPTLARLDAPARTVLQIASMLAPDGVALPWVRAIAGQPHPELAADAAIGKSDPWTQLIRGLIGMRLFQPTSEPRVVAIHHILQRVLETELPDGEARLKKQLEEFVLLHAEQPQVFWADKWEKVAISALHRLWKQSQNAGAVKLQGFVARYFLGRLGWTSKGKVNQFSDNAVEWFHHAISFHDTNNLQHAKQAYLKSIGFFDLGENDEMKKIARLYFGVLLIEMEETKEADVKLQKNEKLPEYLKANHLLSRMWERANILMDKSAWEPALVLQKEIENLCRRFRYVELLRDSLGNQGAIYANERGNFRKALGKFKEQQQLCLELNFVFKKSNETPLADCLANQGVVFEKLNNYKSALSAHREAASIFRRNDLKAKLVLALANQAFVLSGDMSERKEAHPI